MKECSMCGVCRPLSEFSKRTSSKDGRQSRCKECMGAYNQGYREVNKARLVDYSQKYREANRNRRNEYARIYNRGYYAANRDVILERLAVNPHLSWESNYRHRARKFGFDPVVHSFTRDELVAKYGDACHWCGGPFEHLDHAVPVSKGGEHSLSNCVPSCDSCNRTAYNTIRTIKPMEATR